MSITLDLLKDSKWTVIETRSRKGHALCRCICGREKEVAHKYLRNGKSKSCGCAVWTGKIKHPLYSTWCSMKKRCHSPGDPFFHRYGALGITVCETWRKDFWQFVADIGERPSLNHTLDRIDNSAGYQPGNIRWATRKEQANNRCTNRLVEINGENMTLMQAAEQLGIPFYTAWRRANRGLL